MTTHQASAPSRIAFVDLLRGLVICLMVLDHTRDFIHKDALLFSPTDLTKTYPFLFFVRWITHLCAPTFAFLAGVSICLQQAGGKTGAALSRHLFTRGLWLILLELTIVSFGFNFAAPFVFLQIIWALGVSMILFAGLVHLPRLWTGVLGVVIIAGHGLFSGVRPSGELATLAWTLAMSPGPLGPIPGIDVYPILPWFGIVCLGYAMGPLFANTERRHDGAIAAFAGGLLGLFAAIRLFNGYGDPVAWSHQTQPLLTFLAFINVSKYPPSLDYVLLTLGVSLLTGLLLSRLPARVQKPLLTFGRAPLFTYLLHVYLVHGLAVVIGVALGFSPGDFTHFIADPSVLAKGGWGLPLSATLGAWLLALVLLYPLSRAYERHREKSKRWWHSYL